jgi:hypothetical protein
LSGLQNLRLLWLGGTEISDVGIREISKCKKLTSLWLETVSKPSF